MIPPIVALIMQWHTKVKYITRLPLVYTYGFMAVDQKSFDKVSDADKAIVREVMSKTYLNFDKVNLVDNEGAYQALLNSGIAPVAIDDAEYQKVRNLLLASNRKLGAKGAFSLELYEEMLRYIDEYRREHLRASE